MPKADNSANQSGAVAVLEKVKRLIDERAKLKELWRANNTAWADAVAAGRLFGISVHIPTDIENSAPGGLPRLRPRLHLFEPVEADAGSIRERVIDELKKAGMVGIKAAEIRRELEKKFGRKFHEKTIGMTLYRLSQKGQAKRDGITWFHVPNQGTE